ncbi:Nucleotidyltransferase [Singulisphaera sp. GP187]|uniref:DUF427 domain-containing protein n=1 Tax=Singulisphaera sp. GP187 TaxID=1882752 RepID=UPI000927CD9C|nr:DUF427 domain-containing protein [Singulisphaera sp. GP187]SIO43769.1 Nucleotidyltransferase [Singulisphaera sp. GP187]
MGVIIREKNSGTPLAEAVAGRGLLTYEGNLYYDSRLVNHQVLRVSDRTYTCPVKGTCHWVDFVDPQGQLVQDVAWVYADPKSGHEAIKDRFGFYAGARGATRQDDAR